MDVNLKLETINIKQLTDRWPTYSKQNIYELANKGYFGLYVNLHSKRKSFYCVNRILDRLVKNKTYSEAEKNHVVNLIHSFSKFISEHEALLAPKNSFIRLATKIEVDIFPLCASGSIQRIIEDHKIYFEEWNNTFGIIKKEGEYKFESFRLLETSDVVRSLSEDYKGCISKEDFYFILDEIEAFEKSGAYELVSQSILKPKICHKTARENGRKSGEARKKDAEKWWSSLKPQLLEIAKNAGQSRANSIAGIAVKRKLITKKQQSNLGKYIRADEAFKPYLKLKNS